MWAAPLSTNGVHNSTGFVSLGPEADGVLLEQGSRHENPEA